MEAVDILETARPGTRWGKATIATIIREFKAIKRANGGKLEPELVLERARDPASKLHRFFEWDDQRAAAKWRVEQARKLIGQYYILVDYRDGKDPSPMRAEIVIKEPGQEPAYRSTVEIMQSDVLTNQLLSQARAEIRAWKARYGRFKQFAAAVRAADGLLDAIPDRP